MARTISHTAGVTERPKVRYLTGYVPLRLADDFDRLVIRQRKSRSRVIVEAIEEYLARRAYYDDEGVTR